MHSMQVSHVGRGEPGGDIRHGVLQELGADEVVNYREEDFSEKYKDKPFDIVVDCIGGMHTPASPCYSTMSPPACC